MDVLKEAKEIQDEVIEYRRYLHANAETGFALEKTTAFVKEKLNEMGYDVKDYGKGGIATNIGKGKKALMLRADMDALPIREQTGLAFASKNGNMHACGHDIHTAILLGVAKLLKRHENQLKGRVKLYFQPAEERLEGAKTGVKAGVLKDPLVGGAVMLHVMTALPMQSGKIVVASQGVSAPACDYFQIKVQGKSCHGSAPQNGVDALLASAHILVSMQELSAREIPALSPAVLTIGSMHAGKAGNVIADESVLEGTLRAFDETLRAEIKTRLNAIVKGVAKSFRAQASLVFTSGCPALFNDEKTVRFAEKELAETLGKDRVLSARDFGASAKKMGGSEDFAYIAKEVPSVMLALSAGEQGKGYSEPLHHPNTKFDESIFYVGVASFLTLALAWRG